MWLLYLKKDRRQPTISQAQISHPRCLDFLGSWESIRCAMWLSAHSLKCIEETVTIKAVIRRDIDDWIQERQGTVADRNPIALGCATWKRWTTVNPNYLTSFRIQLDARRLRSYLTTSKVRLRNTNENTVESRTSIDLLNNKFSSWNQFLRI